MDYYDWDFLTSLLVINSAIRKQLHCILKQDLLSYFESIKQVNSIENQQK